LKSKNLFSLYRKQLLNSLHHHKYTSNLLLLSNPNNPMRIAFFLSISFVKVARFNNNKN